MTLRTLALALVLAACTKKEAPPQEVIPAPPRQQVEDRVVAAGAMSVARRGAAAVLLRDGRVLVAGGLAKDFDASAAVDLFEPSSGAWSVGRPLSTPRAGHTATLLPDGRVLVAGGRAFDPGNQNERRDFDTTEIWTPGTGAWTPGPKLTAPRSEHRATLLGDGRVLLTGGFLRGANVSSTSTEIVGADAARSGDMAVARSHHLAFALPGGDVLLAGGLVGTAASPYPDAFLAVAEVWSASDGRCRPTGWLTSPLRTTAGALLDGQPVLAGPRHAELWFAAEGLWKRTQPAVVARGDGLDESGTATALRDGRVLRAGGAMNLATLADTELLDRASLTWTAGPKLLAPRRAHVAVLLHDGRVLLAGGRATEDLATAELFVPRPSTREPPAPPPAPPSTPGHWRTERPLRYARFGHTATALDDGAVLVVGGQSSDAKVDELPTELLAAGKEPVELPPLPKPVSGARAVRLADGSLLVVGGRSGGLGESDDAVSRFDPKTQTFSVGPRLPQPREGHTLTALPDGRALVIGGEARPRGLAFTSALVFSPKTAKWTEAGRLASARKGHTATLLASGEVLVAGGATPSAETDPTVELWSPKTLSFRSLPPLAGRHWDAAAVRLAAGRVMVHGSALEGADAAEFWAPGEPGWTMGRTSTFGHAGHVLLPLPDGKLLLAGGALSQLHASGAVTELYDAARGSWALAPNLLAGRRDFAGAVTSRGEAVVAGGRDDFGGALAGVELWVP